ncbi:MAG: DUF4199 domain-containing protein [Bacteroidales bacterium]|nr:DUF4199 domain-containing protein [Bacteroidales bacterium]
MKNNGIDWNAAGLAGLVLGGVSIAYQLLSHLLMGLDSAFLMFSGNTLLWIAKFVGCILLMKMFLKRYDSSEESGNGISLFKHGMLIAALSALVYSAFYFIYVKYIASGIFDEAFELMMERYSSFMDSNSLEQMENLRPDLPVITFFSNLIYCFLYGTVLSSILSRSIIYRDPFDEEDNNIEEQ